MAAQVCRASKLSFNIPLQSSRQAEKVNSYINLFGGDQRKHTIRRKQILSLSPTPWLGHFHRWPLDGSSGLWISPSFPEDAFSVKHDKRIFQSSEQRYEWPYSCWPRPENVSGGLAISRRKKSMLLSRAWRSPLEAETRHRRLTRACALLGTLPGLSPHAYSFIICEMETKALE